MAILPRTLLTQPAPAAVAAVSLFGFTILAMSAHQTMERQRVHAAYEVPCDGLEDELGARQFWESQDYVRFAHCLEQKSDSAGAVEVAAEGLGPFPRSEALYNLKAYNEIKLRAFDDAVTTLESGIRAIGTPSNGVMENNLAWAYLWVGDGGTDRARGLVNTSLRREPSVCETLHTGMFVEFEIARTRSGLERADALRNFQSLRTRYHQCENRDQAWSTAVEAAGAAVLYNEVELLVESGWDQHGQDQTLRVTAQTLRKNFPSASVSGVCAEAMPLRDLRGACVERVQAAIRMTSPARENCAR
mgnify:CR=1 FL=1